jgi:GH43 family beta-xylosidase
MAGFALIAAFAAFLGLCLGQSNNSATYTNPILPTGADPWMVRHGDYYYLTYTTATNVTILRSPSLTDWKYADAKLAFDPPTGQNYSTDLWVSRRQTHCCQHDRLICLLGS